MLDDTEIVPQRTLAAAASCSGVGLHSGQRVALTLCPAAPDTGIVFRRLDVAGEIRAEWGNTVEASLSTIVANAQGARVATIEHLMAAFAGCGVDNAVVELDAAEVPIMDGSARPFVDLIERAGLLPQARPRRAIKILKPVRVSDGAAWAALLPDSGFSMSFEIDFDNPVIRRQHIALNLEADAFKSQLAAARTFGQLDDLPRLHAAGYARGGSLDNVVVISGNRVLNEGGLRFADEFVRHKLLDALGDLYLAGGPIIGCFRGVRAGHAMTARLLRALFADQRAWCETSLGATPAPALAWPEAGRLALA